MIAVTPTNAQGHSTKTDAGAHRPTISPSRAHGWAPPRPHTPSPNVNPATPAAWGRSPPQSLCVTHGGDNSTLDQASHELLHVVFGRTGERVSLNRSVGQRKVGAQPSRPRNESNRNIVALTAPLYREFFRLMSRDWPSLPWTLVVAPRRSPSMSSPSLATRQRSLASNPLLVIARTCPMRVAAYPRSVAAGRCTSTRSSAVKHPCPAWPGQRALHADLMKMLESFRRRDELAKPAPPKPEPLAIIPSGLPIGEVAEKLKDLETKFPGAEVRRGRANHWELWPGKNQEP